MNSEELKSIQAPIKEKYRQNPESAIVTLKAEGKIGEGVSCSLETGRGLAKSGLHPATGGDGLSLCNFKCRCNFIRNTIERCINKSRR